MQTDCQNPVSEAEHFKVNSKGFSDKMGKETESPRVKRCPKIARLQLSSETLELISTRSIRAQLLSLCRAQGSIT